jgi:hypothetical protein
MVHKLKLQNVINYVADAGPEEVGYKFYGITAQNQDTGIISKLHLNNAHYVHDAVDHDGDEIEASRTFDCNLYKVVNQDNGSIEEILSIRNLRIDGAVEYDNESHIFAAAIDENHSCRFEYSPQDHDSDLNFAITGDHLNLFV